MQDDRPIRIALTGPPGIGKSTLVRMLGAATSLEYVDLEDFYMGPNDDLTEELSSTYLLNRSPSIVGGAGFGVDWLKSFDLQVVVLVLNQSDYDDRREERDFTQPSKATQPHHSMSTWLAINDVVRVEVSDFRRSMTVLSSLLSSPIDPATLESLSKHYDNYHG